ncbi:hemagglutinin repeat-containing protein, partial [Xanthomonas sp. SHU 166]|uniref:hemagglutinin repeat-containing protein n=1 Tax=Xanthomonas sp. SHU 166 TaxID=1591170 RepID=UPI0009DB3CC2
GHDLLSQGAQVAGTGNVVVAAGNDLTLETAQNMHSEEHEKKTKKSGMFGSGGIGVTFGTQKIQNNADTADVTHVGSTVGSVEGDVTLVAGNRYAQTGSDVLANAGDITVKAKDIAITEVHDTTDAEQRSKFSQGGLSITLSSAALNLAQSAYDTAKAGSKVSGDARMQALAAGSAAYSAYGAASSLSQTGSALASGSAASAAQGANISIAVTVGGSKSESKSTQSADQAKGSKLQAGGDVNLIATGGGDASNLLVRGSDVTAGHDLLLAADHDVTIEAAKNTAEQHSTSKSSSAAVGVAITYGADGFAAGVTLSASGARGKANGEDVSYTNSHMAAGNNATIISGNDTTLKGAQVSADKVIADVGGNLNIESLQDSSSYASKDKSIGGNVTFGIGFSASASYSSNKVNGDYASVTEQSGIQAGKGGFDITVGGNTDLKGAVIASSQDAIDQGKNRLSTGTLTYSDIANTSSYDAKGISLSGGYSVGTDDDKAKGSEGQTPSTTNNGSKWSWQNYNTGANGSAAGYGHESGNSQSTTHSGISGGALVITDEAGQQAKTGKSVADALAGLKRDVVTGDDANGLTKQWDGQKLQEQVAAQAQITATFGQQATHVIGDYAEKKMTEAADLRRQANDTTEPDQKAQLTAQADQLESQWGDNGSLRVLAHTVVGGLTGGLEGATGAAAGTLAAPAVATALRDAGVTGPLADTLTALASTAAGAVAGGTAGAATASNEVVNNYLSHAERMEYLKAALECAQTGESCGVAAGYEVKSNERNEALKDACTDRTSAGCQAALADALNAADDQKAHQADYMSWLMENGAKIKALSGVASNETLEYGVVTHTTTEDLQHKIVCAMAGSNCSDPALKLQTYLGNVSLGYAVQDTLLRAALTGAGTQVGSVTRTGETIAGVVEGIWSLTPYERFKSSYDDLGYLQENGIGAYMDRNLDQGAKLLHAVKDYASNFGSAVATGALGSWDIYDLYEQGKTQGKVGVDILSLLVPTGAAGEAGTVAAKAGTAFTADELIAAYRQLKPVVSEGTANVATAGELVNYLRQLEHADSSANGIAGGAKATGQALETTKPVTISGGRAIDKAQSYESGVRDIYGSVPYAERQYTTIIDGERVNGVADNVTIIDGKRTAVEAKFVEDWESSIRNPTSSSGLKPWSVAEQTKMVDQAKKYSSGFEGGVIYHTNSPELASQYSKLFTEAGVTNFKFVITPVKN